MEQNDMFETQSATSSGDDEQQIHTSENDEFTGEAEHEREGQVSHEPEDSNPKPDIPSLQFPTSSGIDLSFLSPSAQLNPFRRAINLEDQIREYQRQYDKLYAEVQTLHKVISVKETTLDRISAHLETEKEVSDRTLREIALLDEQLKDLYTHNAQLLNERKQVGIDRILPEDRLDREIQLENELELVDQDVDVLDRKVKDLKLDIKKHDKTIEIMTQKLESLDTFDKVYDLECESSNLTIKINELNDEIVLLQQFTRKKTEQIEDLNNQIEGMKYLEQEQKELLSMIDLKEAQQAAVKLELDIAKREAERKEKTIEELAEQSKDMRSFKHLEQDKRCLYSAIKKEKKKQDELERSTKFHSGEIDKLHQRLYAMNRALETCTTINWEDVKKEAERIPNSGVTSETDLSSGVTVTHTQFRQMALKADAARKKIKEMEDLVKKRDVEIETLEYRTSILEKANATANRQQQRQLQELRSQLQNVNVTLASLQLDHEEKRERLELQAHRLKDQSQLVFGQ